MMHCLPSLRQGDSSIFQPRSYFALNSKDGSRPQIVRHETVGLLIDPRQAAMRSDQELFDELTFYTLAHGDPAFLHQNVVDAFAAQHADESSKPIYVVFALVGLYLCVEKGFTGKQAQRAHMQLAKRRRSWIRPALPKERGDDWGRGGFRQPPRARARTR